MPADMDEVTVGPGFDVSDCLLLAALPPALIWIYTADVEDSLVWVGTVAFVDAVDLNLLCHGFSLVWLLDRQFPRHARLHLKAQAGFLLGIKAKPPEIIGYERQVNGTMNQNSKHRN